MPANRLPDYRRPPVVEIIGALQFPALPRFGMPEVVAVARAFDGWRVIDAPAALPPIVEAPPGEIISPRINLGLGSPPLRVILASEDQRWLVQLQQDRIAVHERQLKARPSFKHLVPRLQTVLRRVSQGLGRPVFRQGERPELVELIYENHIPVGKGWQGFNELNHVLRAAPPRAGEGGYGDVEQMSLGFSYALEHEGDFAGRLHVVATPARDAKRDILHLRLISHRFAKGRGRSAVLEECHADIVNAFTAVTTTRMHKLWGRFR